jgi:hypothetical protein
MKRVAQTSEPPVVVPVVVVTVDVHIALIVPAVEGLELYEVPSVPPSIESLAAISRLNRIRHTKCHSISYQVSSFF